MIRTILAVALALAFTGTAQAEKYVCTVSTYSECDRNGLCRGGAQKWGAHYRIDTKKKTLAFCVSAKGGCTKYKATLLRNKWQGISIGGLGQLESHLLYVSETNQFNAAWMGDDKIFSLFGTCVKL